jgi:hypothetical protein
MLDFDEEKVADKLIEEHVFYARENALHVAKVRKQTLHEKLHPAFMTWLNGGVPEFKYKGFTLESLKEITRTNSYYNAIFHMDRILKNPKENIRRYKDGHIFIPI